MNCKLQVKLRLRLQLRLRLRPCSETQCTFLIPDRLTPTRPACLPAWSCLFGLPVSSQSHKRCHKVSHGARCRYLAALCPTLPASASPSLLLPLLPSWAVSAASCLLLLLLRLPEGKKRGREAGEGSWCHRCWCVLNPQWLPARTHSRSSV